MRNTQVNLSYKAFIKKSSGNTMLFKARPKPKLNVQLRRITELQSYFNPFMTEAVII